MAINLASYNHIFTWKCWCWVCNLNTAITSVKGFHHSWHSSFMPPPKWHMWISPPWLLFSCRVTLFLWSSPDCMWKDGLELATSTNQHRHRGCLGFFEPLLYNIDHLGPEVHISSSNPPVPFQIPHSFVFLLRYFVLLSHIMSAGKWRQRLLGSR